ncbi:MAG: ATP-binding protein, partial [Pseudomonadota bacterium]
MVFKNFSLMLAARVFALLLVLIAVVYVVLKPGLAVLSLLLAVCAAVLLLELLRFLQRTNRELTRFLDAIRYTDFGQRFQMPKVGSGFEELGDAFTEIVQRFQQSRNQQEETLRQLKAMVEHVPVPLLSLQHDGKVDLHNNAARRLFGTARIARDTDLNVFGADFQQQVSSVTPGERRLAVLRVDGLEQRFTVAATELALAGRVERLISLQNIQSELDGVQLQAWQDLVRVLTHEIMNSVTPVASLAKTATDLVEDASAKVAAHPDAVDDLADVKSAMDTIARRSDGLMHFVQSYRQLTRLPPPSRQTLVLHEVFANVTQLLMSGWKEKGIALKQSVEPQSLSVQADREMLEQVLLNLLKNSEQALLASASSSVELRTYLNTNGQVGIDVIDNGPGIDPETEAKIFVPFFTTKREGSGVGLALTRQVMLAHGGSITVGRSESGGARFT